MSYKIRSKSDLLTGASLIVKIPEDELDKKALYTIQADRPDYILPFSYKIIDGEVEFVYQIGPHSKLQYLAGDRKAKDYAQLWSGVLSPLLDCGDWFMKPYSFLLSSEYLYCDKNNGNLSYVYIPSMNDCSDYSALKEMAADVTKLFIVSDSDLENKVLRAVMRRFDPKDFLQMLKAYTAETPSAAAHWQAPQAPARPYIEGPEQPEQYTQEIAQGASGDIIINIPDDKAGAKKAHSKKKNLARPDEKKEAKKPNGLRSLFKRKKDPAAGATPADLPAPPVLADWAGGFPQGVPDESGEPGAPSQTAQGAFPSAEISDVTQSISTAINGAGLRHIGRGQFPEAIEVMIAEGEFFSIGRYDSAVGRRQSSFEFDKKTKAVSRRHAVIERDAEGYSIVDLASSAGTFVNDQRIPPNTPCKLEKGNRVSFGNCGADYVWDAAEAAGA